MDERTPEVILLDPVNWEQWHRTDARYLKGLRRARCVAYYRADVVEELRAEVNRLTKELGDERIRKCSMTDFCTDIAPGRIAMCVPPDKDGMLRTPWCHLPKGHSGPHRCGEYIWDDAETEELRVAGRGGDHGGGQ